MSGSNEIYRFLSSVWDNLPVKERNRFGELWKGYQQVSGDVMQRIFELDLSVNVNSMPVFLTTRWNKYDFTDTTKVTLPATFKAFQDISLGVDLSTVFNIRISIDDGTPFEVDCRGTVPAETTIDEIIFNINQAAGFPLASGIFSNTIIQLQTQTTGPTASIEMSATTDPAQDATELILGITSQELPLKVPRLPYKYSIPDSQIRKIPSLQDKVRNENLGYYIISGPDFEVNFKEGNFEFREEPPEELWAKVTFLEEEMAFYNFGWLVDYRDTSITAEDYLQNLQGLWFAFWQGPRPEFIRRALALLFSLPVAASIGVVTSKKGDTVEILHDDGITRAYILPSQLNWVINVGDFVERFQMLTDGIDVFDKTNLPGFVKTEIGRDALSPFALPEATLGIGEDTDETKAVQALEEHTFLPQINVNSFVRPNINVGSIFRFLENIKPLHKAFYFQVIVAIFNEDLEFNERFSFDIDLDITPNLEINQANTSSPATRESYETVDNPTLDLDSDVVGFFEKGTLSFEDIGGPLPQFDVVFD